MNKFFYVSLLTAFLLTPALSMAMKKCLYVSSYHQGYAWSDGVEKGLRETLKGKCKLRQFDMDTKRHKSIKSKHHAASQARHIINQWQPDVVITADDNAARYLIKPYYKDAELPFVFCGVNWTVTEYGFPYSNVTGMVEVAPIKAMLRKAVLFSMGHKVLYLGADTSTERKNLKHFQSIADQMKISLSAQLVQNQSEWLAAYKKAQQTYDFLIIGSFAGINDWHEQIVFEAIMPITKKLSVTNHKWMMPVSLLGFTKVAEEQGEWAGLTALAILEGLPVSDIPIIANRKWDLWINEALIDASGLSLPTSLLRRAKKQ